jgi:hypothetical protein
MNYSSSDNTSPKVKEWDLIKIIISNNFPWYLNFSILLLFSMF